MKRLSALAFALMAPIAAFANLTPNFQGTTGTGPYVFSYSVTLSSDADLLSGMAPNTNPVQMNQSGFGGFFTIYDFAGYVANSCVGPSANWTCTVQNTGYTPNDVLPPDNGLLPNITWTYTSGPTVPGGAGGVELGTFSATSIYNQTTSVAYTSRVVKNATSASPGTNASNVGTTRGPTAPLDVPEPGSVALAGLALGLLAWTSRGKAPARA